MTRLFNLESYSELCTHANLYETEINSSLAYKHFFDRYRKRGYRNDSLYFQELTIQDELIPLKHLGVNLSQDRDHLYVVGDRINSLSLRDFLRSGEKYIYRSVYHYWNYRQQIANNLDLNNSVVVVDLGSLSDEPYCSLQFEILPNSPYPIPIIDNRREVSSDFKLTLDIKNIHHNIYHALAQEILTCNFPQLATNNNTVEHLKSYLQKIEVFKLAQSQNESANFSIIVEIFEREKIYFKSVCLDIALLENIVINRIDFSEIARFTQKYSEHSFVLISDYNFLPKIREVLKSGNIFIPQNNLSEFPQIWLEKQQQNFPLFGQYLDKIEFQVQKDGKIKSIEVLSTEEQEHIYYEGDPQTKRFIACIQETGQDYFKLLYPNTILPIKINGQDYCINKVPQEYQIIHPWSESKAKSEELRVRIEFIIKLGSVPQLSVTDKENKYTIEAQLRPRPIIDHIPLKTILENRRKKNCYVPREEQCQIIVQALSQIQNINSQDDIKRIENYVNTAYKQIHRSNRNVDLLLNVTSKHSVIEEIKRSLISLNNSGIINEIINYLASHNNNHEKHQINKTMTRTIMLLGKTYKLSENLTLKRFFERDIIRNGFNKITLKYQDEEYHEYFLFLSRVALTKELQLNYFNIFSEEFQVNKPLYQIKESKYLWGYSRILLWYSKFYEQYTKPEFDYVKHFKLITEYLSIQSSTTVNDSLFKEYRKDAFLSLIYLLTFRGADSQFCTTESSEYQLAEKVVDKYRKFPVYLKAIPDKSLNECFEELLKGRAISF